MTTLTEISSKTRGSAFLFEDVLPTQVFTPEDLTEEHLAIGRMIDEFWQRSRAQSSCHPREAAGRRSCRAAEVRGTGPYGHDHTRGIWRHGNGLALPDG